MPQPATHYLVVRRAIPEKYWKDWWNDSYKRYFGLGTATPDLFYFPTVPKIVKDIRKDIAWDEIAGVLHSNRSYDMFCALLDIAKSNKLQDTSLDTNKQFAFAVGYYAHVITDCIFHPYIFRNTEDLWCTKNFKNELDHKNREYLLDQSLYELHKGKMDFSRIEWTCNHNSLNAHPGILDHDIATLLHKSLNKIYPNLYPCQEEVSDPNHPVQQAYNALLQCIKGLFESEYIILFGDKKAMSST